jgi:hypothetical protein
MTIHGIDGSGSQPPIATEGILVLDPYSLPPITSKKKPNGP